MSFMLGWFVRPTGFEPVTVCLEGRCSILLSYERIRSHSSTISKACSKASVAREIIRLSSSLPSLTPSTLSSSF